MSLVDLLWSVVPPGPGLIKPGCKLYIIIEDKSLLVFLKPVLSIALGLISTFYLPKEKKRIIEEAKDNVDSQN